MERFLKWLDDLDDFLAVLRLQTPGAVLTLLLFAAFLAIVGAVFVFGPPVLHAAP